MPHNRLFRILAYLAVAFAVLDFVSSIAHAPGCGGLAGLHGLVPDLRMLAIAWIDSVANVVRDMLGMAVFFVVVMILLSRVSGAPSAGRLVSGPVNWMRAKVLPKVIAVLVVGVILHAAVQALVALLC